MPTIKTIQDLTPDPHNANAGSERGQYMLEHSIRELGLGRSIVADKNGVVIGGNKTLEVAGQLGFERVIEVESDGKTLVVVKRTDLDMMSQEDNRARALAYADNRAGEVSLTWDTEVLRADFESGLDLAQFWHEDELAALLGDFKPTPEQEQSRLDTKTPTICPHCGKEFTP